MRWVLLEKAVDPETAHVNRRPVQAGAEVGECLGGGHGFGSSNSQCLASKYPDPDSDPDPDRDSLNQP